MRSRRLSSRSPTRTRSPNSRDAWPSPCRSPSSIPPSRSAPSSMRCRWPRSPTPPGRGRASHISTSPPRRSNRSNAQWATSARSPPLAVVPVTIHIPLAAVPAELTRRLIVSTARIVDRDMRKRFGIARPRLALAGLNPHAGEGGAMGREEIETIAPAIAELAADGLDVVGPLPADTMFHPAARARYDVALTMYHDQGLIPAKTLAFDDGVNVTLGLPFVRTSPDHGTAFDIAGKGLANPASLIAALKLADRLTR